jgi:hypothetical protein
MNCPDGKKWREHVKRNISCTWRMAIGELVKLPPGKKAIVSGWVFHISIMLMLS